MGSLDARLRNVHTRQWGNTEGCLGLESEVLGVVLEDLVVNSAQWRMNLNVENS